MGFPGRRQRGDRSERGVSSPTSPEPTSLLRMSQVCAYGREIPQSGLLFGFNIPQSINYTTVLRTTRSADVCGRPFPQKLRINTADD